MHNNTTSRKQQIEEKATLLFRKKGYSGTSMRDLAQELHIEAASLYSHIRSKEEILKSICFKMASLFFAALDKVESYADKMPVEEKLRISIVEHIKVVTHDVNATAVFLNEWRHLSQPHLGDFMKLREEYEQRFIEILKKGKKNSEFVQMDEKLATQFILSSINWTYNWFKPSGRKSSEEIGNVLATYIINGIKEQKQ